MQIVDLTLSLYSGMVVYPGDPEVKIKQVHTLANEGWRLRTINLSSHIGTHVNVPSHMVADGETMDDIDLNAYVGPCRIYSKDIQINQEEGLLFGETNITEEILGNLMQVKPKFVGLSESFEFDIFIEKRLLEESIISFENLTNLDKLPTDITFQFYGVPLKIKEGDGSPVRAFAVIK